LTGATTAIIHLRDVVRSHGGLRPLRIRSLSVHAGERLVLSGLDAGAAQALVDLVTGAVLPESGEVLVDGRPTSAIAADMDWLASLDRFGLVTERAVLVPNLSIAANLALPLTISVDPLPEAVRRQVESLAGEVGLPADRLGAPAGSLTAAERLQVHLARAIAPGPGLLILEHPTSAIDAVEVSSDFGRRLSAVTGARGLAWIAISEDRDFAVASGARRLRLKPGTGDLVAEDAGWRRWFS
jgi:ABC-type sugar transport system ATPase subunit